MANTLVQAGVDDAAMAAYIVALEELGPEHVIVDLPKRKADAIRIMARYPDGTLKIPEFSFNPVKWADAYDLQKRTGYVFCPREVLPIVALAARVEFMTRYGVVMGPDADGYIKAGGAIDAYAGWIPSLVEGGVLDKTAAIQLQSKHFSLLNIRTEDLRVPSDWLKENPDFAIELAANVKRGLRSGLVADDLRAFTSVMAAMFAFMDMWYGSSDIAGEIADEADLQKRLSKHLRSCSLSVAEGSLAGGGKLDLFVADTVLIENKFKGAATADVSATVPAAGAQGRRYAIALLSQIVLTVAAVRVSKGTVAPQRTEMVEIRQPNPGDGNRVELRFTVPFGAVLPSAETAARP